MRRHRRLLFLVLVLAILAGVRWRDIRSTSDFVYHRLRGRATVSDRLDQYGPAARARWRPYFDRAGLAYPPDRVVLVGLKQEKRLEVYAGGERLRFVRSCPILAASGRLGPKLRYGDGQVPEGLYRLESLNPNSLYHLSMRVSYPNANDQAQARRDGRTDLGGDIMIHGSRVSVGCLAMGDEVAEDLFVLAADTGLEHIDVVISPVDFRERSLPEDAVLPAWTDGLYRRIRAALEALPNTPSPSSHA